MGRSLRRRRIVGPVEAAHRRADDLEEQVRQATARAVAAERDLTQHKALLAARGDTLAATHKELRELRESTSRARDLGGRMEEIRADRDRLDYANGVLVARVRERDATIADLTRQLGNLRQSLDAMARQVARLELGLPGHDPADEPDPVSLPPAGTG